MKHYCIALLMVMLAGTIHSWPWEQKKAQLQTEQTSIYQLAGTAQVVLMHDDIFKLQSKIKNLFAQNSYVLVNAANQVLYLGGGIAGIIKKWDKSGNVQKSSDLLRHKYGAPVAVSKQIREFPFLKTFDKSFPVGTALVTESGDLKQRGISYIIHAIAPNCNKNGSNFEKDNTVLLLQKTYANIISRMLEKNFAIVACPSLSTGAFKCNIDTAATTAAETMFPILNNIRGGQMKIFIIVTHTKNDYDAYKKIFNKAYEKIQRSSPKN